MWRCKETAGTTNHATVEWLLSRRIVAANGITTVLLTNVCANRRLMLIDDNCEQ
jgi:hypothetical protein